MVFDTNREKGRAGLALAIGYYGSNGYTISIPLNDTQDYDLIIDDGERLQKVQVKAIGQRSEYGISIVTLTSAGGTNGQIYKTVKDTNIDLLFVVTELGELYEIPFEDITQSKSLNLGNDKQHYRVDNQERILRSNTTVVSVDDQNVIKYINSDSKNIKQCVVCGVPVSLRNTSGFCLSCAQTKRQLVERPSKEVLLKELQETNFSEVGRKYSVSDNAIRKWCKAYKLPTTIKEIKNFSIT